ncbi:MAG: S-adenosyl-l-methionine hydroxide adenosyltransferase [Azospira oryzae]|nr:MAG: S-adenosyl-l-methionine hydroxide adenosyltransferase [Azospira oryzae]
MAIVTLLTDSGESDHYVAAIKAKILSVNPGLTIVDISHKIGPCDLAHGAFVLKAVFRDFPKGTVHLAGIDATGNRDDAFIAVQLEDHFFVGTDNGLFSLISDKSHQMLVDINKISNIQTSFPERDILAPAAARLASNVAISSMGIAMPMLKKLMNRHIKANKKIISGHVIRVDGYGNLITNIPKDVFDTLSAGKTYTIQFGGEKFKRIHTNYHQADQGDCFLLFNSLDLLEIGIYKGNACELLGMSYDSPVSISFDE